MKIAFLGTPDFAVPSLKALVDAGYTVSVFTQPDKPVGRHGILTPPAVKKAALEYGLPVFQFDRIKSSEGVEALKAFGPDLMVTAAFGQILSRENLDIPPLGCVNVHGSLLPKYRGAAPIQWAIINGECVTGVTTMLTELGLDSGAILMAQPVEIGENETAGELFDRLAELGAELLIKTVKGIENGTVHPVKQDESLATRCTMINKEDGRIDFSKGIRRVHDLVRGMNPWPCAYAMLDGNPVKIWRTVMTDMPSTGMPGACAIADPAKGLFVDCGDGLIEVTELQFPGAKRMDAKSALRGHCLFDKVFE